MVSDKGKRKEEWGRAGTGGLVEEVDVGGLAEGQHDGHPLQLSPGDGLQLGGGGEGVRITGKPRGAAHGARGGGGCRGVVRIWLRERSLMSPTGCPHAVGGIQGACITICIAYRWILWCGFAWCIRAFPRGRWAAV